MKVDRRSPGPMQSYRKLTEGLIVAQRVEGRRQKVTWPHGNFMEVDGSSPGRKESRLKLTEGLPGAHKVDGS